MFGNHQAQGTYSLGICSFTWKHTHTGTSTAWPHMKDYRYVCACKHTHTHTHTHIVLSISLPHTHTHTRPPTHPHAHTHTHTELLYPSNYPDITAEHTTTKSEQFVCFLLYIGHWYRCWSIIPSEFIIRPQKPCNKQFIYVYPLIPISDIPKHNHTHEYNVYMTDWMNLRC